MLTVIKLGGSHAASTLLRPWLAAIEQAAGAVVLVPGGGPFADAVRSAQALMGYDDAAAHEMALLAMTQFGRALTGLGNRLIQAASVAAIGDALAARLVPVWSPSEMLRGAPDVAASWDVTSDSLAVWLASLLSARQVVLVKQHTQAGTPAALADRGLVDAAFPGFAARFAGRIYLAGPADLPAAGLDCERPPGRLVH